MANLHKKPSKAELQAEIDKTLEVAETPIIETPQEETPAEEVVEEVIEETPAEETPQEEISEEEEQPQEQQDYKKKFVESTREAQVLHAKNKQLVDAIDEASLIDEPTEEELAKEYSDWDLMTDTEKRLAKDSLVNSRRFKVIHQESKKFKDLEAWNEKVNTFADDPKTLTDNPELEGKLDEFKLFASKPTRRGVDFTDLIPAFLYNESQLKAKTPPKKGQMFEQGTGGNTKPKPKGDKISTEEGRLLMKTDYNKFKEMLKAGKIELPS
jgi:hypothetical protein